MITKKLLLLGQLNAWVQKLRLDEVEDVAAESYRTSMVGVRPRVNKTKSISTNWLALRDLEIEGYVNRDGFFTYAKRYLKPTFLTLYYVQLQSFFQKITWRACTGKRLFLYSDEYADYPLIRHLAKKTDEDYSLGWYNGLVANKNSLEKFRLHTQYKHCLRYSWDCLILFNTSHNISKMFIAEMLKMRNILVITMFSLRDYYCPLFLIVPTTKTSVSLYYYYHLFRSFIYQSVSALGAHTLNEELKFRLRRNRVFVKKGVDKLKKLGRVWVYKMNLIGGWLKARKYGSKRFTKFYRIARLLAFSHWLAESSGKNKFITLKRGRFLKQLVRSIKRRRLVKRRLAIIKARKEGELLSASSKRRLLIKRLRGLNNKKTRLRKTYFKALKVLRAPIIRRNVSTFRFTTYIKPELIIARFRLARWLKFRKGGRGAEWFRSGRHKNKHHRSFFHKTQTRRV